MISGVRYYSKVVAARLNSSPQRILGEAIVWLIEPLDTGRSASAVILRVLRDGRLRRELLTRVGRRVDELTATRSVEALRALSQCPTSGDAHRAAAALSAVAT
jgi:hypothetical protein